MSTNPHPSIGVDVFYNAIPKDLRFAIGSTVGQIDEQAVAAFQVPDGNRHTFGLFRADGITELQPLDATVERVEGDRQAGPGHVGIREDERLILRAGTVRGGG
ncbi:MAG TPA: hypothetical protein VIJ03_07035 [Candidatus Dormibacteraeota bacterium]